MCGALCVCGVDYVLDLRLEVNESQAEVRRVRRVGLLTCVALCVWLLRVCVGKRASFSNITEHCAHPHCTQTRPTPTPSHTPSHPLSTPPHCAHPHTDAPAEHFLQASQPARIRARITDMSPPDTSPRHSSYHANTLHTNPHLPKLQVIHSPYLQHCAHPHTGALAEHFLQASQPHASEHAAPLCPLPTLPPPQLRLSTAQHDSRETLLL